MAFPAITDPVLSRIETGAPAVGRGPGLPALLLREVRVVRRCRAALLAVAVLAGALSGCARVAPGQGAPPPAVQPPSGPDGEGPSNKSGGEPPSVPGDVPPAADWDDLVGELPPPALGDGFFVYHGAVGRALAQSYRYDPCITVEHGIPYQETGGQRVYEYSWVHFPAPFAGGEPLGFDTGAHFTVIVTPASDPQAPALAGAMEVREIVNETAVIQIIKDRGEYRVTPFGVGADGLAALARVRRVVVDAYLKTAPEFWPAFEAADWTNGAAATLPGVAGGQVQLAVHQVRSEEGYLQRHYTLTAAAAPGGG